MCMEVLNEHWSLSRLLFLPGYRALAEKIRREGYMGVKAFFWAELTDKQDGTFKVFHGKPAPFQKW